MDRICHALGCVRPVLSSDPGRAHQYGSSILCEEHWTKPPDRWMLAVRTSEPATKPLARWFLDRAKRRAFWTGISIGFFGGAAVIVLVALLMGGGP